jgi:hypothetical protein
MKTYIKLIFVALSGICFFGCHTFKVTTASTDHLGAGNAATAEKDSSYQIVSMVTWEVTRGVRVEARLEVLTKECRPVRCQLPYAHLVIKNLLTNKIIYQRDESDRPESLYNHGTDGLVVNWRGGSADRIEILSVNEREAHRVLYESYRFDAAVITFSGDEEMNVLITTAEGGGMPLYTTRYVWKDHSYQAAGRVPFKRFSEELEKLFNAK